jgi:hypothetical protein
MGISSTDGIFLSAEIQSKVGISSPSIWEVTFRKLLFKKAVVVGDTVTIKIYLENNSGKDTLPGKALINVFINEERVYAPTEILHDKIKNNEKVVLFSYPFVAFKTGVIRVHLDFQSGLKYLVKNIDETTGVIYHYDQSNNLKPELIHDRLEVYTVALLYSTLFVLVISLVSLFTSWFHL